MLEFVALLKTQHLKTHLKLVLYQGSHSKELFYDVRIPKCSHIKYCKPFQTSVQQGSGIDSELVLAFLVKDIPENFVTENTGMPNAYSTCRLR